jgi:citrate lyase subunit beta/citryl-CoA lyase
MTLPRTYLFVPGNRPDRLDKAVASEADAVIFDLEDAVAPADKPAAREAVSAWLRDHPAQRDRVLVRINDESTGWFDDDVAALARAEVRGLMVPKAERAASLGRIHAALPADGYLIALVETARGLLDVDRVAAASGVQRLAFGTLDYAVDLDLSGDERGLIEPSTRMALVSRAAGIGSPIAGVTPDIQDEARLLADFAFARAFGFGAKLCIHPKQVTAIHRALTPTAAEVDWARRVLAAAASSQGAVQLDGKMIDRPVILKAQAIVQRAGGAD